MSIPENCKECYLSEICKGPHYGGSYCSFQKEINEKVISQILKDKK